MDDKKRSEGLSSPMSHTQASLSDNNYDLLTGSTNEGSHRVPYLHHASALDGDSHEQKGFAPVRAAGDARRQELIDDESSSKAKMWDPVKDCSLPNTIQADLPSFLSARHGKSEQSVDSAASGFASMGLDIPYPSPSYGQVQDSANRGVASTNFYPSHQLDDTASGFQGGSSIGYSMGFQPFSLDSTRRGAALTGVQPRQAVKGLGNYQENYQPFTGTESRMLASMAPHEAAPGRPLCPISLSAEMSEALTMARYAETLDKQSSRAEAVQAYQRAGAMFQAVIIRSCSFEERMQCNYERERCLAHLDVLLRGSAASSSSTPIEQDEQQDDDGPGGGKPQYSLLEDLTLCRKAQEELSWQEVAETPMFKGRRKHRSLSQRKHTIGKMGPRYQESEKPFTEEENQRLCAMGDSGKTLGDIQRKFRSRNGEHCLKQYWLLKGYPTTGRSRTSTSHQARSAPALHALSTKHTLHSSIVARHGENPFHASTPIVEPVSHRLGTGTHPRPNYHASSTSSQINQFVSAQSMVPDALGGTDGDPASPEATGNKIKEWPIHSERWKLGASPSSSATTANSPTYSTITTSPLSPSAVMNTPLESYNSLDSLGAAANRVRESQRTAQLEPE